MLINKIKTLAGALAIVAITTSSISAQQLKVPAPSPLQTVKQAFALSDIQLNILVQVQKVVLFMVMSFLLVKYGAQVQMLQPKLRSVKM